MSMNGRRIIFTLMFAALAVLSSAGDALAQCAMCKASIENSPDAAAASSGLNLASIVLLLPPVILFAGLFVLIYRFRNVQGRNGSPRPDPL